MSGNAISMWSDGGGSCSRGASTECNLGRAGRQSLCSIRMSLSMCEINLSLFSTGELTDPSLLDETPRKVKEVGKFWLGASEAMRKE